MTGNETSPDTTSPIPTPAPAPRRRIVTYLLLAAGVTVMLAAVGARHRGPAAGNPMVLRPVDPPPAHQDPPITDQPAAVAPAQKPRPRVELVFALDTTGSMTGLIEGAKRKIWSLASFVARGQPTPDLRVGLVAYRDIGDEYVTRVHDLDDDMDRVYARLRQFRADGGGDGPEHVARALHEAVHRMTWTDSQEVVKVIYLVGDAPPHTDYHDGFDVMAAARAAGKRGIQVHTIRCGDDPSTEASWRRIASLGHGQFLTIEQDGGMADATTPYDEELGRLHDAVSHTALGYGGAARSVAATTASVAAAPPEAKAERAAFMAAKRKAIAGRGDLVDDVASGAVALSAVPVAELPAPLVALEPEARPAKLEEIKRARERLLDKVAALSKKRDGYLKEKADAAKDKGEKDGFDAAAKRALKKTVSDNPLSGLKL
jgi:hypothetical protein